MIVSNSDNILHGKEIRSVHIHIYTLHKYMCILVV